MESSYITPILSKVQHTIPLLLKFIKSQNLKFDAILCRGVSGIVPSSIIGYMLNVPVVIVRKEDENSVIINIEKHYFF